ncbi:MAG: hypothetical protein ACI92S_003793, partial [Planctomycetaceae bacterium]
MADCDQHLSANLPDKVLIVEHCERGPYLVADLLIVIWNV